MVNSGNRKRFYIRDYQGYKEYALHTGRSLKAYLEDRAKRGKITLNKKRWIKNPRRYDFAGIDTPLNIFVGQKVKGRLNRKYNYKHRKMFWKLK